MNPTYLRTLVVTGSEMAPWLQAVAESVLLPDYRGQGLYRAFFEEREGHARRLGKTLSVFCAVQRMTSLG